MLDALKQAPGLIDEAAKLGVQPDAMAQGLKQFGTVLPPPLAAKETSP